MASKSKQLRNRQAKKRESPFLAISVALVTAGLALLQNEYGQFSDVRGYYGMRFSDGMHAWPFSYHTLLGTTEPVVPVQYPALMGLIMWIFSFFVEPSEFAWVTYYQITSSVHIVIFALTTYLIFKLSNAKFALIFSLSPAVLYSLNRNWDIWAVATMLLAILLFEKKSYKVSAFVLAVSIAIKFFPVVLLLPVLVFFARNNLLKECGRYIANVIGFWLVINFPFMLINFEGWFEFYRFSFEREIGSASFFEVTSILGIGVPAPDTTFYALNLLVLMLVVMYLVRSKNVIGLAEGTFFTLFAFILFNKQYSMQYVIWLAALAVLAVFVLEKKSQFKVIVLYGIWQASELLFQYSFFQWILTSNYKETATPASPEISDAFYGATGIVRYSLAIVFTITLGFLLSRQRRSEHLAGHK
jgi:uncharacterized membrane protein